MCRSGSSRKILDDPVRQCPSEFRILSIVCRLAIDRARCESSFSACLVIILIIKINITNRGFALILKCFLIKVSLRTKLIF